MAMAAHLVYIKTKTLLAVEETISELDELINSLEELKAARHVCPDQGGHWDSSLRCTGTAADIL